MLLKSLKKQILKKKIESKLKKVDAQLLDKSLPIKTVGCLVDRSLIADSSYFYDLFEELKIDQNKVSLLSFSDEGDASSGLFGYNVTKNALSWKSDIVSDDAREFISHEYDLLINFFKNSNSVLGLISAHSNALFRIGFENIDNRFNDLIFSTKMSKKNVFKNELFRYLKIMNKI